MPAAKKTAAYDPAKRYAVTLARVVEHEGFTLKPGPDPIEMTGAWANLHADAISAATELPDAAPLPAAVEQVHEVAER